jgi:hypothetical protein
MCLLFGIQDPQRGENMSDLENSNCFICCLSMNDSGIDYPALNHMRYITIPTMYDFRWAS